MTSLWPLFLGRTATPQIYNKHFLYLRITLVFGTLLYHIINTRSYVPKNWRDTIWIKRTHIYLMSSSRMEYSNNTPNLIYYVNFVKFLPDIWHSRVFYNCTFYYIFSNYSQHLSEEKSWEKGFSRSVKSFGGKVHRRGLKRNSKTEWWGNRVLSTPKDKSCNF